MTEQSDADHRSPSMITTDITFFARFKETFGSNRVIKCDDTEQLCLKDVLVKLCRETPGGCKVLFDNDRDLLDSVLIMHNKKRVPTEEADTFLLEDGDSIILYPPVSGG